MALLYRVGSNRVRSVSHLLCSRLSALPAAGPPSPNADFSNAPPVHGSGGPGFAFIQLRSFAAPVQSKSKVKPSEDASGTRINNAIKVPVVRLVTEEGHFVLSIKEALDRAKRLDLDLVEVQKTANPPVCKIMNFNKEKYKKELTERERLKTKSALSKRSGEKKEVRFKAKTEIKDLKVKADGITRLMERGYRVKCTALPSGSQQEDLGEHLSRLLKLIEEVAFIESGPHVDAKQAYVIVRHVKFDTKKSPKKSAKIAETKPSPQSPVITPPQSPEEEAAEESEWECDSDESEELKVEKITEIPSPEKSKSKLKSKSSQMGLVKEEEPVPTEPNRYAKKEHNQPIAPNSRGYNNRESPQVPVTNNNNYNPPRQFQPSNFQNPGNPNFSQVGSDLRPFQAPKFGPNVPNRTPFVNPNFSEQRGNLPPFQAPKFGPNIPNRNPGFSGERSDLPPLHAPKFNQNPNFSEERNDLPPLQAPKFVPNIPNRNLGNPNFSDQRNYVPPFQSPNFGQNIPNRNPNFSEQRNNVPPFQPSNFGQNIPNRIPGNPNFSEQRINSPPFQAPNFGHFRKEGPVNPNFSEQRSNVPPFQSPNFGQFRKEGPLNPNSSSSPQKSSENPNFSQERSNPTSEPPKPKFGIFNSSTKSNESGHSGPEISKFGIFSPNKTNVPNN